MWRVGIGTETFRKTRGSASRRPKSCCLSWESPYSYLSLCLLVVSVTISGPSMVAPEHSGDPGEPDRQSLAFGRGQSVQQLGVLGVQFLPDPPGRGLPVVSELESVEASIVWVPLS
jgi:hypothetical protein